MAITNSTFSLGPVQRDGRRYCTELHTDNIGKVHLVEYLAAVGADYNAIMTARAATLDANLKQEEYAKLIRTFSAPVFQYGNITDLLAVFRQSYQASRGIETCQLARWLIDRLNAGDVTVTQCRTAFGGISVNAWNTINGTMDTYAAAYSSVQNAAGE